MIITQSISWQPVNWPDSATTASQYAIFLDTAITPLVTVSGSATSTVVTYNDTDPGHVYLIRPTDGTNYGPAQSVVIANQPLNNRAYIRQAVRKSISDRQDTTDQTTLTFSDDELNDMIVEAVLNYSMHFPVEASRVIPLVAGGEMAGARTYALPSDYQKVLRVKYTYPDTVFQYWLKELPYKGGETSAQSYFGYPKMGILFNPIGGRFFPGHYSVYQNQLTIDFDPTGEGDTLSVEYLGNRPIPTDDVSDIGTPNSDIQMILLRVEASAWLMLEGKDVRLSRWRSKDDGGRRDDLPTDKMSTRLFNAYNQWVKERKTQQVTHGRVSRR